MSSDRRSKTFRKRWGGCRWLGMVPVAAAGLLLGLSTLLGARTDRDPRELLGDGMRVKVEGRFRGEGLYRAHRVGMKGDRKESLRVEGIIQERDPSKAVLTIADIGMAVNDSTEVLDSGGVSIGLDRLGPGMRVRVHVRRRGGTLRARRIEVVDSRDRDTEITAPVEGITVHGNRRMEISVLGRRFRCDESTVFIDPDGERLDLDFGSIDAFRRLVDSDDQRPEEQFSLGDLLTVGGEFQVDAIPEKNFDLYDGRNSDVLFSKLSSRLEFSSSPYPDLDLFLKVAASQPMGPFDSFHPLRSDGRVRLAEANLLWRRVFTRRLGLRVGRQDFDEKREWLYDENLDGVRLYLDLDPVRAEISVSTNFSEISELDKGVVNYILYTSYRMGRHRELAAYVIDREDRWHPEINFDRRWYGIRSFGGLGRSIDYWVDLTIMRGEKQGREIRASALDVGFTHVLRGVPLEPAITFGYAYATGDHNYKDNIDGNFRQTGFDDNNDKFNGVNSFKYYGEVFNPELSNMRIYTSGVGFRWARRGSFDIVYHLYRQVVAKSNVHGGNFLVEPWGMFQGLGDEIDLMAGYEKLWKRIDLEIIYGIFQPDYAFGPFHDTATRSKVEIEYNF